MGQQEVQLIGVQPLAEMQASDFDEKLIEGEFLNGDDGTWVILGQGVAHKLALEVGDKLVLMAQGANSVEIRSLLVRVRGILRTGLEGAGPGTGPYAPGCFSEIFGLGDSGPPNRLFDARCSILRGVGKRRTRAVSRSGGFELGRSTSPIEGFYSY